MADKGWLSKIPKGEREAWQLRQAIIESLTEEAERLLIAEPKASKIRKIGRVISSFITSDVNFYADNLDLEGMLKEGPDALRTGLRNFNESILNKARLTPLATPHHFDPTRLFGEILKHQPPNIQRDVFQKLEDRGLKILGEAGIKPSGSFSTPAHIGYFLPRDLKILKEGGYTPPDTSLKVKYSAHPEGTMFKAPHLEKTWGAADEVVDLLQPYLEYGRRSDDLAFQVDQTRWTPEVLDELFPGDKNLQDAIVNRRNRVITPDEVKRIQTFTKKAPGSTLKKMLLNLHVSPELQTQFKKSAKIFTDAISDPKNYSGVVVPALAWSTFNQESGHAAGVAADALQKGDTETAKAQIKPFVKGVAQDLAWQAGLTAAGGAFAKGFTGKALAGKGAGMINPAVGTTLMAAGFMGVADAFVEGYTGQKTAAHIGQYIGEGRHKGLTYTDDSGENAWYADPDLSIEEVKRILAERPQHNKITTN